MKDILKIVFIVVLVFFISPVFVNPVAGDANITAWANKAPLYANTRQNISMVNITFYAKNATVVLSGMNVTLTGTASPGNISVVRVFTNDTSGTLLGSNNTWTNTSTYNYTFVNFTSNYVITSETNVTLFILYEVANNAKPRATFGANVTIRDINANDTIGNDTATPVNSSLVQIQDVHANASISPRIVDTNVTNQNFYYNITPTGSNAINWTRIVVPTGYTITGLVSIYHDDTFALTGVTNQTGTNDINITFATPTTYPILVNLTINTNNSAQVSTAFYSNISGSNLTWVATDVINNQTNVTTKTLINYTFVNAIKSAAYVNGTDYWEFNFTLGFNLTSSESLNGLIQFKMTNWTDSAGRNLSIINSTGSSLASLREGADFNNTNKFNITNDYNITTGISKTSLSAGFVYLTLRMIIPLDTPVSSTWWSTYSMIFRSLP